MRPGPLFLNNRYHDPTLGVFLSVDPLVSVTGEPYIYAGGNPTTLSDPSGLDPYWAQDKDACNDNGYYSCGYVSHGPRRVRREVTGHGPRAIAECSGRGFVSRGCLPVLLPDRYGSFVGAGDGLPNDKVDYRGRPVEEGERELCQSDRMSCLVELDDLRGIKNLAESSPVNTDNGDGTLGNGRRHVILAAMLTWALGEDRAREILDAHENIRGGQLLGGHEFDSFRQTDLINNDVGIELGLALRDEFGVANPESAVCTGRACAYHSPTGFYSAEGMAALEAAVLASNQIVYFTRAS